MTHKEHARLQTMTKADVLMPQRTADLKIAEETLKLAAFRGMNILPVRCSDQTCSTHYHHLEGMLDTMVRDDTMDAGKRGRFVGWMQCAVTLAGFATMDEWRHLNKRIILAGQGK